MILSLNRPYKSFKRSFAIENLPNFTILTGINGSGKTQILNGIAESVMTLVDQNNLIINKLGQTLIVDSRALAPPDYNAVSTDNILEAPNAIWSRIKMWQERSSVNTHIKDSANANALYKYMGDQDEPVVRYIIETSGINPNFLTRDQVIDYYPGFDASGISTVFNQNLALLFVRYHERWINNQFKQFLSEKKGISGYGYLTESEFTSLYGELPPWATLNNILQDVGLNFTFNFPNLNVRGPFELKLINNKTGAEIKFSDLSSGEKVVMSLVFATYTSNHQFKFPQVLLMDEPDASLHPSMARLFLRTVNKLFVEKHGVKVIMTTHSPASVALADEESLFVVNATDPRIQKVNKDQALRSLNENVPSFSVNYENRRQIFTEGKNDVKCYEGIYNRLADKINPEISLSFISSGKDGNGNQGQAEEVVKLLRKGGNKFVFAIIDRDASNHESQFIKILGNQTRYSIENFIFDPVIIGALLLRNKVIRGIDAGLGEDDSYRNLGDFSNEKLQILSNFVCSTVKPKATGQVNNQMMISKYVGGNEVIIPFWYANMNGHELEKVIKIVFHPLQKYNKEAAMKDAIVKEVLDDHPELIPLDFLNLFANIQNQM
jgi:ABC-type multidrug transport system ATPase subunit